MKTKCDRLFTKTATFWAVIIALCVFACTDSRTSLGNSAESGNPEIAGVLYLSNGDVAASARVQLVPSVYSALTDSALDSAWTSFTDSLGRFAFTNVPEHGFTLEAMDSASGQMLLLLGLSASSDTSVVEIEGTLENTGSVRLGAHGFADGTTGYVMIPGTTILRRVTVELGNIFVDSLPADSLSPFVFVSDDGWTLSLDRGVEVVADSTVPVEASTVSFGFRVPLNTTSSGINLAEDLRNFPLMIQLDSSDYDFDGFDRVSGVWSAILCGDTLALDNSYADVENGKFTFWVRVPKLRANSSDTLFLYFKENAASSFADSAYRVFSDTYVAAWHFDGGTSQVKDATGNHFDGDPEDVSVAEEAVAGSAYYYDGKSGSVTIRNSTSDDFDVTLTDPITFAVWVKMEGADRSRVVFGKGASQYKLMYLNGTDTSIWLYEAFAESSDSTVASMRYWYKDSTVKAGEWTYLVVTQDSAGAKLYVDGALSTETANIGTSSETRITDSLFVVGKMIYPAEDPTNVVTHYFKGVIDELHVSRSARSAEWIRASFENQNPARRWPVPVKIAE